MKRRSALGDALRMAEEASRAKTIFLSNMSHDIRTPMNAIIGFTNIAFKQGPKPEVRECLEKIGESSEHLLTLINDVLDISRIESGKMKYNPKPLDITAVTDTVMTSQEDSCPAVKWIFVCIVSSWKNPMCLPMLSESARFW